MLILLFGGTHILQVVRTGELATQMMKNFFVPSFCHRIAYFKGGGGGGVINNIQNFSFIPPPYHNNATVSAFIMNIFVAELNVFGLSSGLVREI